MLRSELVPSLALFTIVAVLVIAVVLLVRFLRKPKNQHPMEGQPTRNIAEALDQNAGEQVRENPIR